MANDEKKLHIAMFPWLAFGHMIPYLELAKLIASKGHLISFISTPRNIDRLPKIPPTLASLINFVKLPLPHVQNLPDNAEATSDVPLNLVPFLKRSYDALQDSVTRFLEDSHPDWLLHDFCPYWLPPIARKLGIPSAFFSIVSAAALCFLGTKAYFGERKSPEDFTVPPRWVPFPTTVAFRLFEVFKIFGQGITGVEDDVSDVYRFVDVLQGCDIVAVRGCVEFEPEWLRLLEDLNGKPVLPVGQLPTTAFDSEDDTDTWRWMKAWLDLQSKGSVVYVAFGSEALPSQTELTEIALGLEQSKLPFFWVLRTRKGPADTELIELPEGFEERTKERGVVCTSWAPQLKILAHESVGGFLTHSGWSSVVESLQFERPLILLTFYADQGINAKVLDEKKIGYLIPRKEQDGSFTRDSVAESLRLVTVEEEGKAYRDKAKEMKGLFGDRDSQDRYVNSFLGYLKTHLQSQKVE
ncbi:UDP-glycosyltransferase 91A1-like [Corylus avellana]|uniref:UDP-glycosyltransferase 91A1-like n=1 Tax=Corylus avellana TaxID=13451 RepID=UPI001E205DCF|nr:UDP-glycosyltransferase 91A1-like [Corylus avellana]XP_059440011.1 UDP-glycosyltransferase 91A1-like [Corylus avellana]